MYLNISLPIFLLSNFQGIQQVFFNLTQSTSPAISIGTSNTQAMPAATAPLLDVLIIGGGPAGLAAATGLARQLYTAVVFDSGVYRNQLATHMHNVVTWDHARPADFRQKAREDIRKRYSTIDFQDNTKIESVKKNQEGRFEATDEAGTVWTGRKLLLATGIKDIYPDIDGYGDAWGTGMHVYSYPPNAQLFKLFRKPLLTCIR